MIEMAQNDIAVVIPAYRAADLHKTLQSLAYQTDRNFTVYLCDDCSTDDIKSIADDFEESLHIVYHRFDENLGQKSMSAHLARCLALVGTEGLVCFLSDDNELTRDCIRRLRKTVRKDPGYDIYHWNTNIIDYRGDKVMKGKRWRRSLSTEKFFRKLFFKKRFLAPLSSFVFRKEALSEGLCTDDDIYRNDLATIMNVSGENGIRTVRRARVLWRSHSASLSVNPVTEERIARSMCGFLQWTEKFFGEEYPIGVKDRMRLFAKYASKLYPTRTADEVRELFFKFNVFSGTMRKLKGRGILRRALKERTSSLKGETEE